jgi:3-methyladenine DNA glycosylase AlkD
VSALEEIHGNLLKASSKEDAANLQRYFKTGPGEYGEGDKFIGIRVGPLRALANKFRDLSLGDVEQLLQSVFHEERMLALLILVNQYQRGDTKNHRKVYDLYLENIQHINNWDLVDVSAPRIVGAYLSERSRKPLYRLAKSRHLWSRRVAIMATLWFIRSDDFSDTFAIADVLMEDDHDLIHKAVGWMLREVGNRDQKSEEQFLKKRYKKMPRTMLRYAIEKFPKTKRRKYLDGTI